MKKGDFISLGLFALFCVIFWNILDFVYSVWIKGGSYSFTALDNICLPVVIGVTMGYLTVVRKNKSGQ